MIYHEVIIVGGGPAGAACAWKLVRAGIDCIVLDKSPFPRPKTCAGWIAPRVLSTLGMAPGEYPHGLVAFDRLHFYVYGVHIPLKTSQYSIRRCEWDAWLLERSGAEIELYEVKNIEGVSDGYVVDGKYRCRYLIGAGGTHCPVYRTFFREANPRARATKIAAVEAEIPYEHAGDECHLWFFENGLSGYSWYVPKGGGHLNVGVGGKQAGMEKRGRDIRWHWDRLIEKLIGLHLLDGRSIEPKGLVYYLRHKIANVRIGNCFVAGDACGLATKDMGEGIGPAIESGVLVARSIIDGCEYSLDSIPRYSIPAMLKAR